MRKLFGTDGIRAVAGEVPLDRRTVFAVGVALAHHVGSGRQQPRVVLGMDTRESSPWIAAALSAGLRRGGALVESAGVITTPAIAFLARTHGFSAGVVISASHNPWQDNGIKIFGPDGFKLPDATELAIEDEIFRQLGQEHAPEPEAASVAVHEADRAEYVRYLLAAVDGLNLSGMRIVVDCAHGAASAVAPQLFGSLGGEIRIHNASPNGRNINESCGALHPEVVARLTVEEKADLGITFDGDADRALFADAHGRVVNGDAVMLLAGRDLKARGLLQGDTVVATTMSNMGLEAALKRSGIHMMRAPVGDKYVLEQMQQNGASLGGEQSGHILFTGKSTTGDGLLTALLLLEIVQRSGKPLADLLADLQTYPQVIVNVRVREKKPLDSLPSVREAIAAAETDLQDAGRVVIRYSGTEALARVMIEAENEALMQSHADRIAAAIRSELGV